MQICANMLETKNVGTQFEQQYKPPIKQLWTLLQIMQNGSQSQRSALDTKSSRCSPAANSFRVVRHSRDGLNLWKLLGRYSQNLYYQRVLPQKWRFNGLVPPLGSTKREYTIWASTGWGYNTSNILAGRTFWKLKFADISVFTYLLYSQ